MRNKRLGVIGAVILGFIGIILTLKSCQLVRLGGKTPAVLPPGVTEKVTYNEKTHTLTVVTPTKTVTEYAKNPDVQLRKGGDVVINRHLTGFEQDFFLGVGYSDCGRIFLGLNFFHFSRFDVNVSLGGVPDDRRVLIKPYLGVGYNVYSNTSLNVAANPIAVALSRPDIAVFVSIKF